MVFALLFSRLLAVLFVSSIILIILSLIFLRFIKLRTKEGKTTNTYFPIVLRTILIVNIVIFTIALAVEVACLTYKDEGQIADEHLNQVIEAIENHDKDSLKSIFSKTALNEAQDLNGRMDYLFGFVQGDIKSWEMIGGGAGGVNNYGHWLMKSRYWYNVKTDKEDYLFFLYEYTEDTDHPENVGLYMLQVIKAANRYTQFDGGQDILCAGIYHPSIINVSSTKLTAEELNKLEFLRAVWTENQMIGDGFELKQNQEYDRIYSKGYIEYHYGNELGNGTTPDWVSVYGDIDVQGPRDISVGDRFEDVLSKFPKEKNWKDSESGVFYGEFEDNDDQPYLVGAVGESGDARVISIYPKEGIPCLFIYFKNDVVVSYTIEMQFLNP